jgi:hypothetical protein
MTTIIVAGPPHSGVEAVAKQASVTARLSVVTDGDIRDMQHLNELLESDVIIATSDYAHIVHTFVAVDKVIYVIRKVEDIEWELELAECDQDADIEVIVRDVTYWPSHPKQAFDELVDLTQSLPRILYQWWEWQKSELEFWRTDVEEIMWKNAGGKDVES